MKNNKKDIILIEFLGLPGCGKTSIVNELVKSLNEKEVIASSRDYQGKTYTKLKKYPEFISLIPFKHLRRLHFYWRKQNYHHFNKKHNIFKKYKEYFNLCRGLLITNLILKKINRDFKFLISDEGTFQHLVFYYQKRLFSYDLESILNTYPKQRTIFVYLDTEAKSAYSRMKKRDKKIRLEEKILQEGNHWGENYYKEAKKSYERLFIYLTEKEKEKKIKKAIKLDGQKSIEENVKILKDLLNKYL